MARKAAEPLEKKDIILFKGDWDKLAEILAPFKVRPTVFIRALVRKKLLEIENKAGMTAKPVETNDDLDLTTLAGDESAGGSAAGESEPTVHDPAQVIDR